MRLLIVEDDRKFAEGVVNSLTRSSYEVQVCPTGDAALTELATSVYNLVIMDLGLPDMDGIDLLRRMRAQGVNWPVIILTSRDQLGHRIRGLDAGADDYLVKPIAMAELEARIRAHLRRAQGGSVQLRFGTVEIDNVNRQASTAHRSLTLTLKELAILEVLVRRQGRNITKEHLFESIYDARSSASPSALEVHICRLRKKLRIGGADVTVRSLRDLGYRLERTKE